MLVPASLALCCLGGSYAIAERLEAREQLGRGRYSLWTGDLGLAIYLRDWLTVAPRFPTVDIF